MKMYLLIAFILVSSSVSAEPVCKRVGESPGADEDCCESLIYNGTSNVCEDFTYINTSLASCSNDAQCSGGNGCFSQRPEDVASGSDISDENKMYLLTGASSARPIGESCIGNLDCKTVNCVAGTCSNKMICRNAAEGEIAIGSIACEGSLQKDATGKCGLSPDNASSVYSGLIDPDSILTSFEQDKCQYEVDPDAHQKMLAALKTFRGLEWLFSTIGLPDSDDCLKVLPFYREKIKDLLSNRKELLKEFSIKMSEIENDYNVIMNASENSDALVMYEGLQIKESELANRKASGVDALKLMYRRNVIFQEYESVMLDLTNRLAENIKKFNDGMKTWTDGADSWQVGDSTVNAYRCSAFYQKRRIGHSWRTYDYTTIGTRWDHGYVVDGNIERNKSITEREKVLNYLSFISGIPQDEVKSQFSTNYSLVDPIMPGNTNFSHYGTNAYSGGSGSSLAFYARATVSVLTLGLFGSTTQVRENQRAIRSLEGSTDAYSYTAMRANFLNSIKQFYRDMKAPLADGQRNIPFIYEPELTAPPAKDCFENPNNEHCDLFNQHLEELADIGFAQFLAYSKYGSISYAGFFPNASTWRRKLFDRYETDLTNISVYYSKVIELRELQNNCIMKVHNQVVDNFIDNTMNGINTDTRNYYEGGNGINTPTNRIQSQLTRLTPAERERFNFNLSNTGLKSIRNDLLQSLKSTSTNSGSGSVSSTSQGSAAVRSLKLKDANKKAASKGANLAKKEKNAKLASSILGKQLTPTGAAGVRAGAGGSSFGNSNSLGTNNDSLSKSASGGSGNKDHSDDGKEKSEVGNKVDTADLLKKMGFGGGTSRYDSSSSTSIGSSNSSGSGKDATGLSDEEKDVMMANYERNKNDYNPDEEDGLFKVVSKAYVRNLEKILTKKKKEIPE